MRFVILAAFVFACVYHIFASTNTCSPGYLLCENERNCVEQRYWCDGYSRQCSDGSDEKYCNYISCPTGFIKCSVNSRRCIPSSALCDGFPNCDNGFDEENCAPKINETETALLRNASVKAKHWILGSVDEELRWEEDTQRALVSLYLADPETFKKKNEHSLLLANQLELRFAWDLLNNSTSPMSLFSMSGYINAFLATCKDPSDYHGMDLARLLRRQTNAEEESSAFISPFVYLTLCLVGKSTESDLNKMREIFISSNHKLDQTGLQSLAYLVISCIERSYSFSNITAIRDEAKTKMIAKAAKYGDLCSASLLFQAMTKAKKSEKDWKRNEVLDFILQKQEENGSFGNLLNTYYAMPIITRRSLETLSYGCNETKSNSIKFTYSLQESKAPSIAIKYSLYIGRNVSVKHMIQMFVVENSSFFDVMKIAEKENPKFKFKSEMKSQNGPTIFSIGGISNDIERGMFWTLYTVSAKGLDMVEKVELQAYFGDLRNLKMKDGKPVIFWYKPI